MGIVGQPRAPHPVSAAAFWMDCKVCSKPLERRAAPAGGAKRETARAWHSITYRR